MLAGFMDDDQPELMARYVDRYFEVVSDVWHRWTPDMARWFVSYAYPSGGRPSGWSGRPPSWSAGEQARCPPAWSACWSEGRDGLRRALRCQQRDRQAEG